MRKRTIEECQNIAHINGGKCLETEYTNNTAKMVWSCEFGHTWQATPHDVFGGHWCPYCAGKAKHVVGDCIRLAESKGGRCLDTEYVNIRTKMQWECGQGFRWNATFGDILNGHWCPHCVGLAKHTIDDCIKFATGKSGKCLSLGYINTAAKMDWECHEGHRWSASFNTIMDNHWCPHCVGLARHTIDYCRTLATQKKGRCLSSEYVNSKTRMEWQCELGHRWFARLSGVLNGTWCPECSDCKTQRLLKSICESILGLCAESDYRDFDWLKTDKKGHRQEIDIWFPQIKLAIEYDGKQHFEPIEFFGGEDGFKNTCRRDQLKNNKIRNHPEDVANFLRFSYKDDITIESVRDKLLITGIRCRVTECA